LILLTLSSIIFSKGALTGVDVYFMRSLAGITSVQGRKILGKRVAHGGKCSAVVARGECTCADQVIVVSKSTACRPQLCGGEEGGRGHARRSCPSDSLTSVLVLEKLPLMSYATTRSFYTEHT
jgi:hypothetical protein